MSYQLSPRAWFAVAGSYGSGLPVEFVGNQADAVAQFGQRIVDRVDLDSGRVRPSVSRAASASLVALKWGARQLRVQADATSI